jgi:hypothetical protein
LSAGNLADAFSVRAIYPDDAGWGGQHVIMTSRIALDGFGAASHVWKHPTARVQHGLHALGLRRSAHPAEQKRGGAGHQSRPRSVSLRQPLTYQPLPRHPFFPAIFTEQMQLELLKVASSGYKYWTDGAPRPLCHPTLSLVLFFACKSSAILWE